MGRDKCIHWCHCAPGFVPLLLKMAQMFNEPRYGIMAVQMGDLIWERGLLRQKGPGLCHGIPGNGYAFLALHCNTPTGSDRWLWLRRARHFATFTVEQFEEIAPLADRPYSLFEGMAGALSFWQDILTISDACSQPDSAASRERIAASCRFPGYVF